MIGEVLWPMVAVYAVWRFSQVAEKWSPPQHTGTGKGTGWEAIPVPDDLMALAMTHSETWAQEDTLKAIRERYEQLQDWNRVRSAFGVGSIG